MRKNHAKKEIQIALNLWFSLVLFTTYLIFTHFKLLLNIYVNNYIHIDKYNYGTKKHQYMKSKIKKLKVKG